MTFSNSRRSSNETHGGRRDPRTQRPVRHRNFKTYFPVGSILVVLFENSKLFSYFLHLNDTLKI